MKAQRIFIKSLPEGKVKEEHFEFKEVVLGELKEGELLVKTLYLSVDPYMRGRMPEWYKNMGKMMLGHSVAQVLESKSKNFKKGDHVYGVFSWATHNIVSTKNPFFFGKCPPKIEGVTTIHDKDYEKKDQNVDLSKIEKRYFLGAIGMPSQTAYFGLLEQGQLKKGECVLISGAAGAVGSVVGQIAKNVYGCKVVGIAGKKEKLDWLKNDLGFDGVINYKEHKDIKSMQAAIKKAFNDDKAKVDVYFDNVGGIITESVWDLLNMKGRIVICGQIAIYQDKEDKRIKSHLKDLIYREIEVKGVSVMNHAKNFPKFYKDMGRWILNGKVKVKDTVVNGFKKAPNAFCGLFTGVNIGKMVIKCE